MLKTVTDYPCNNRKEQILLVLSWGPKHRTKSHIWICPTQMGLNINIWEIIKEPNHFLSYYEQVIRKGQTQSIKESHKTEKTKSKFQESLIPGNKEAFLLLETPRNINTKTKAHNPEAFFMMQKI